MRWRDYIETNPPMPSRTAELRRTFALILIPSLSLYAVVIFGVLATNVREETAALKMQEAARVEIAAHKLTDQVNTIVSDLMVLAHGPRYNTMPDPAERARIIELYATFSREKAMYDQVRFLDTSGMEVVRINYIDGKAVPVPDAELQPKGRRYYFLDAIRLNQGDVYMSPLDLNMEHGAIELPLKPVLRVGTPVFDHNGVKRGVVMLNFLGRLLIDNFRSVMKDSPHAMLLNQDGYWLSDPDPAKEWGFMFKRTDTFASTYPEAWQGIQNERKGLIETQEGLFAFATTFVAGQKYSWTIVSFVPSREVPSLAPHRHPFAVASFLVGIPVFAWIAGLLAAMVVARRHLQTAVASNERQLRDITDALGVGVFVLDGKGRLTYANPEAGRLLGWSQQELLERNAHETFHHHTPGHQCKILNAISSRRAYRSEDEVFWRRDETELAVEVSCHPLANQNGASGVVVAFQDISARKSDAEQIRRLAYFDTLTNLPNRRMLLDRLNLALRQAARYERSLAVLFLDLDFFKQINDTLGHDIGDKLLKEVADRLTACIRRGDTVSRQGGDEFVVLLPEIAQPEDAALAAQKLIDALNQPFLVERHALNVTTSIGIAIFPVHGTDNAIELMKKADIAMYAAKAAGRNSYRYYESVAETGSP